MKHFRLQLPQLFLFIILLSLSVEVVGLRLPLPSLGDSVVGALQFVQVKEGERFADIARRFDLGFYELVEANPHVNPDKMAQGTLLIVPTKFILPPAPHQGIVINLGAMRLYYFPPNQAYFYTYPVGIGKENWATPLGILTIIEKIKNPIWHVPESIYRFRQQNGDPVPHNVGPGPDNPLGQYALRLSKPTYLIHGTNDPSSVGRRSSAGCIHLYPEDILQMYKMASTKTSVTIINQPYLIGWQGHKMLVEAHLPLQEQRELLANHTNVVSALVSSLLGTQSGVDIDWLKAYRVLKTHIGIPLAIGILNGPEQKGDF